MELVGLTSAPRYNGMQGAVVKTMSNPDSYLVNINGKATHVMPENVKLPEEVNWTYSLTCLKAVRDGDVGMRDGGGERKVAKKRRRTRRAIFTTFHSPDLLREKLSKPDAE